MSKILYIFDAHDLKSRIEVAHKARDAGHDVAIGLIGDSDNDLGFKSVSLRQSSYFVGLLSPLSLACSIRNLIKTERPDILHVVTLKYSFIAGLATLGLRIGLGMGATRKIYTMAGLGYLFRSDDIKSKILRIVLTSLLQFIFRRPNTRLIFQNSDDLDLFVKGRFVKPEQAVLIKGSGVYLDHFKPNEKEAHPPIVLMPTRLVHEKGVSVFIDAARLLKARDVPAHFQIAGGETKHNPKAISRQDMEDMVKDGTVEWLGRVDDLSDRLARAALIVYPSYYGEGVPRVLLEACATGKAIVTTDHPGCKEAVDHGQNGFLVPVKDIQATADAIEDILSNAKRRIEMGQASREKAEQEFDIHVIATKTVAVYDDYKSFI